jgi:hypothetical protein
MRFSSTSVAWHRSLRPQLEHWRDSLSSDPLERDVQFRVYTERLESRIKACNGIPPEALCDARTKPATYWMELTGGTWVQFAEQKRSLFSTERRIVIVNMTSAPPTI